MMRLESNSRWRSIIYYSINVNYRVWHLKYGQSASIKSLREICWSECVLKVWCLAQGHRSALKMSRHLTWDHSAGTCTKTPLAPSLVPYTVRCCQTNRYYGLLQTIKQHRGQAPPANPLGYLGAGSPLYPGHNFTPGPVGEAIGGETRGEEGAAHTAGGRSAPTPLPLATAALTPLSLWAPGQFSKTPPKTCPRSRRSLSPSPDVEV